MSDDAKKKLTVKYKKIAQYRNYHVDGIYGGLTPKGLLLMEFFVEKNAMPEEFTHLLDIKGQVIPGAKHKPEIVREIEGGLIMDYAMMKSVKTWLQSKITEYENSFNPPTNMN